MSHYNKSAIKETDSLLLSVVSHKKIAGKVFMLKPGTPYLLLYLFLTNVALVIFIIDLAFQIM